MLNMYEPKNCFPEQGGSASPSARTAAGPRHCRESDYFIADGVVFSMLLPSASRGLPAAPLPKPNAQGKIERWSGEADAPALRVLESKVIVTIGYKTKYCRYHTKNNIFL